MGYLPIPIRIDTSEKTILTAKATYTGASSGNTLIAAPAAGLKIKIVGIFLSGSGTQGIVFKDGTTELFTAITINNSFSIPMYFQPIVLTAATALKTDATTTGTAYVFVQYYVE